MKKILTIILDGFGIREETHGNAIKLAKPNNFENLWQKYPHSLLYASEEYVGLEKGQFGNSEVGHLTIGAGRKMKQPIERMMDYINQTMKNDETFLEMIRKCQEEKKKIHIMGLFSDGKVHSDLKQILKVYDFLVEQKITNIYFHIITDGRDTKTTSAQKFIKKIEEEIAKKEVGKIATICGRYYAMDRDHKWERTQKYYNLVTRGMGISTINIKNTIDALYEKGITDEFLEPILVSPEGIIKANDIILWMNYRTDRAKQILSSFVNEIDDFPRIAETEKYAHVTYFFDGEYNGAIEGSYKYLIPSPKVATYDLKPEMSAVEITKKAITCMEKDIDFILVNFANPDMVGHTGVLDAAIKAIMAVDLCLGKLIEKAEENFYKVIILADHGNADIMLNSKNEPVTTHTLSQVPFIITDEKVKLKPVGDLTMVAPTILEYMDIAIPKEMKETESLLEKK